MKILELFKGKIRGNFPRGGGGIPWDIFRGGGVKAGSGGKNGVGGGGGEGLGWGRSWGVVNGSRGLKSGEKTA